MDDRKNKVDTNLSFLLFNSSSAIGCTSIRALVPYSNSGLPLADQNHFKLFPAQSIQTMRPKTIRIIYWILLGLLTLMSLFMGYSELFPTEPGIKIMQDLGYPLYMLYILGVTKILGAIALVQNKYKTIKEWAYAGFTIDYLSASASFAFIHAPPFAIIFPLIFQAWLMAVYFLWKKVDTLPKNK